MVSEMRSLAIVNLTDTGSEYTFILDLNVWANEFY
jgi:hypothetical protein